MILKSAEQVLAAMRRRFTSPEYAFFEDVANATGASARRRADALVMGLWPSRGLHLHGYEIKVSRGDVLRELKNPHKAEAIADYCDFWWMVVGDPAIVKLEELPANWGLLVPHGKSDPTVRVVKEAVALEPKPVDRRFLASVLRNAAESYSVDGLRAKIRAELFHETIASAREAIDSGHEAAIRQLKDALKAAETRNATLVDQITAMGRADSYGPDAIRQAIDLLHRLGGWSGAKQQSEAAVSSIDHSMRSLGVVRDALKMASDVVATLAGGPVEPTDG